MTAIERSILLNASLKARAEADAFSSYPKHAGELRHIAQAIEAVLASTEQRSTENV